MRKICVALSGQFSAVAAALVLGVAGFATLALAQDVVSPGANLGIASAPNLRDVGGYWTKDGSVVRRGVAYRSSQLNPVSAGDMKKIAALGLRTEFDLRSASERAARPDELPPGVKNVWLNVQADAKGQSPAEIEKLMSDPRLANEALGKGKGAASFVKMYRELITLPSAKVAYRRLFAAMEARDGAPYLFHCTGGKDRTGWAAAALLTLLGVPEDKVYEDYLRSNEYILPAYKTHIERFVAAGGDPSIPQDLLGVKAEYLRAAFDQVKTQYGSIEAYFEKGLGIDAAGQQKLKSQFLDAGKTR